ncbi:3439_t:CDS:2, partial [Dentiscutata heterogama]
SENDESNDSENEEDSTTSDEDEEDSTTSEEDEEDSSDMEDDIISLYLEDDFDEKSSISRKLSKEKFNDPDDSPSSSDSSKDLSDSSKSSIDLQDHKFINFIPPEIDPEVFDPPFNFEDNSNDWIILWVMKYQQRFNIPDT